MKINVLLILLFAFSISSYAQKKKQPPNNWDNKYYETAKTAANIDYMTEEEKNVFYYLNLARMNPKYFANTFVKQSIKGKANSYEKSLLKELRKMKPMPVLEFDKELWKSAKCHAIESGKSGYVGHERKNCNSTFSGECCSYGTEDGLGIVLQLLIDEDIPSLGHRRICLGDYTKMGVSIKPHKTYSINAVLNFD